MIKLLITKQCYNRFVAENGREERKRENKSTLSSSFALCRHVFMRCTSYDGYGKRFQVTQAPAVKDMLTRRRAKLSTLCFFLFSFSLHFFSFSLLCLYACMLVAEWKEGRNIAVRFTYVASKGIASQHWSKFRSTRHPQ